MGTSVTRRIAQIRQPRNGYVPLKSFDVEHRGGKVFSNECENLAPGVIGTTVDNLTRLLVRPVNWTDGKPQPQMKPEDAFCIALYGASLRSAHDQRTAKKLAGQIEGLDDQSIASACMLSVYDAYRRAGEAAFIEPESLVPDGPTTENIRSMVERCVEFFEENGPVTSVGPTFGGGGYSKTVDSGDADYLTNNTIWDLKVMAGKPKIKHTLQVYMYYLMGKRSDSIEFLSVNRIGIYNPRLDASYTLDATTISEEVKERVEYDVIGYDGPDPWESRVQEIHKILEESLFER